MSQKRKLSPVDEKVLKRMASELAEMARRALADPSVTGKWREWASAAVKAGEACDVEALVDLLVQAYGGSPLLAAVAMLAENPESDEKIARMRREAIEEN